VNEAVPDPDAEMYDMGFSAFNADDPMEKLEFKL
jgi:hypothetical protein